MSENLESTPEMNKPLPGWYPDWAASNPELYVKMLSEEIKGKNKDKNDDINGGIKNYFKNIISYFSNNKTKETNYNKDLKKSRENKNNIEKVVNRLENSSIKPVLIKGELVYQDAEVKNKLYIQDIIVPLKLYAQTINDKFNPNSPEYSAVVKEMELDISELLNNDEEFRSKIVNIVDKFKGKSYDLFNQLMNTEPLNKYFCQTKNYGLTA